jgi:transcriptional regulator with XRE-family HTH domain
VFYDKFVQLCHKHGVSPTRAALDANISKSLVTKWKTLKIETPSPDVLIKLSKYFGITVAELLGEQNKKAPMTEEDIKVALFGGDQEVTDEDWAQVKNFVDFIKSNKKK